MTSPSCGFSLAESGMMMPLRVVSCSSIRFTTMRSYKGRMFIIASTLGLVCSLPMRRFLSLDRQVPGILSDHLAHLIPQFLPVSNEVASLIFRHYFDAFLFKDGDHGLAIHSIL